MPGERIELTRESYVRLRERVRVAEARYEAEVDFAKLTREWALEAFAEQRRLSERLSFVVGVARSLGATWADLTQEEPDAG